jgi:hypothetical protein
VRQVPVLLGEIEPIADDEPVLDLEPDVVDRHVDQPARRLAQQARRAQVTRRPGAEDVLHVVEREARVDDVLDDYDVAPLERALEILQQLHLARRSRARAVARDRHEVERAVAGHRAREIREEDERALEHGDEVHPVGMIAVNLVRHFTHALLNGVGRYENLHRDPSAACLERVRTRE